MISPFRKGVPAPDSLLEADDEVHVKSVSVRQRVHEVGPGVLHKTESAEHLMELISVFR